MRTGYLPTHCRGHADSKYVSRVGETVEATALGGKTSSPYGKVR